MEGYRPAHPILPRAARLSRLYADAKKSALASLQVQSTAHAQFASLHRKYRIQKDRLITWGLEWTDAGSTGDEKDPKIDESVAKAGLTETVESVLTNIHEVTEEAERIKSASVPLAKEGEAYPQKAAVFDEARYEDLLKDLTTSIDILYDLTISRRALARGEHPRFDTVSQQSTANALREDRKAIYGVQSFASSETTLVNPSFSKPFLSPYAGLPARIEASALRLPAEGPPPYEAVGVPSTTRMVALLVRKNVSSTIQNALANSVAPEVPVLVEYANYDATYRHTGVPPPLQRLEALASRFQPMRAESQTNLSLLGYFEDGDQPRIGLVYDLPYSTQNRLQAGGPGELLAPLSLLKLVQKGNKAQSSATEMAAPALEHRFRMALRLTEQLHSLHARELAHGNINSSSVMFTTTANESETDWVEQLRKPLWASFDLFSKCNIDGVPLSSQLNVYRHPLDEPSSTHRGFPIDMKYDIYGLGLILLEIGLWTPIGDLYKPKYTLADFKLRIEKIWIPKLGAKCGSAYMRAVETCLRLSDDTDTARLTAEGVYGLLLQFLKRCCLLDDVGSSTELIPAAELMSEPVSPAQPSRSIKRRGIRRPSEVSSLARQASEPASLSIKSAVAPQRYSTLSSANATRRQPAANVPDAPVRTEQTSTRGRAGPHPSMHDFKRRVTLIQTRWRACKAAQKAREANAQEEDAKAGRHAKSNREEFLDVALPQHILDHWQSTMCYQVLTLAEKALKGLAESSSIRLAPYGESRETARPTIIIGCRSTSKVKHCLKRHLKYDPTIYDIRVKKEVIKRCRKSRKERALSDANNPHRSIAPWRDPNVEKAANPDYQVQPMCGASIGAYRYDEHLPPVSFGGVVLVDGRPFGMSVHHMLEPEEDSDDDADVEDDAEGGAEDESETSSLGSSEGSDDEDDLSTVRPPSAHSSDEMPLAVNDDEGDCPGIVPGDLEEIAITQPALDDAIDLDLHAEEDDDDEADCGIDEDHLLSYRLGQIHASSGLRRTAQTLEGGFKSISQSLPQEIDWALFELVPPRVQPYNVIRGGKRYCKGRGDRKGNSFPCSVRTSDDLACAKVHCLGRTSGLAHGIISSTMELVKIHGRSTYSASWTVAGNFGVGGDSGAWVISNDDGRVCGHVLASRAGRTYICPMDLLLEDIRTTLNANEVTLPVLTEPISSRPASSKDSPTEQCMTEALNNLKLTLAEADGGVAIPVGASSGSMTIEPV